MCLTPRIANNISLACQRNMYYKYKTWQVNLLYIYLFTMTYLCCIFVLISGHPHSQRSLGSQIPNPSCEGCLVQDSRPWANGWESRIYFWASIKHLAFLFLGFILTQWQAPFFSCLNLPFVWPWFFNLNMYSPFSGREWTNRRWSGCHRPFQYSKSRLPWHLMVWRIRFIKSAVRTRYVCKYSLWNVIII